MFFNVHVFILSTCISQCSHANPLRNPGKILDSLSYHNECLSFQINDPVRQIHGIHCGNSTPPDLMISASVLELYFFSDTNEQGSGFRLIYEAVTTNGPGISNLMNRCFRQISE